MEIIFCPATNNKIVRHLLQPRILAWSALAAFASAIACYPRLALWTNRADPVWYLEGTTFLCGIVLWGFVFAWHTRYSGRPWWVLKPEPKLVIAASVIAVVAGGVFHFWLDPSLQTLTPMDYPASVKQWFALELFSLAFGQLFLLFAPFAWLLRLLKNRQVAAGLTVLFGASLLLVKMQSLSPPVPPLLLAALLAAKIGMGLLAVWFYLRGGVLLIWWWTLLFAARQLLGLAGHS